MCAPNTIAAKDPLGLAAGIATGGLYTAGTGAAQVFGGKPGTNIDEMTEEDTNKYLATLESKRAEADAKHGAGYTDKLVGIVKGRYKAKSDEARAILAPDLTVKAVQEARKRQARQLTLGQGRRSTFLSGPAGDTSAKPLAYKSLFGQ